MIGIATIAVHTQETWCGAKMFVASAAEMAITAADPAAYDIPRTDRRTVCLRTKGYHLATGFMPHDQRETNALGHGDGSSTPQVVLALPDVGVTVAHARTQHLQQDLCADRHRRRFVHQLKQGSKTRQMHALHFISYRVFSGDQAVVKPPSAR
ncbi:hypothetical protein D9M68_782710 [compost metagenome]